MGRIIYPAKLRVIAIIAVFAFISGTLTSCPSPANHPPVLDTIGDKKISAGNVLEFTVRATDPDNDSLTFTISNLPPKATFDNTTGIFTFKPETAGSYPGVSFSVTDGKAIVSQSITITVLPGKPGLPTPAGEGFLPLPLFYYGDVTPDIEPIILKIKPQYLIINPSHGLWGEITKQSPNVFLDISVYKAAGIKVIGYVTAGYQGRQSGGDIDPKWYTLEMNKKLIKDMAEIDHVDGVFFDECSAFPDDEGKKYLKELTDFAHSYGLITWGNVGSALFSPWFFTDGGFDLVHSNENWYGQNLTEVQRNWGNRISVTGFHNDYNVNDAFDLTVRAWRKGLAYCSIYNLEYHSLPSWSVEYAEKLRQYQLSPDEYQLPVESVNTTGIVVSAPSSSGASNEYNLMLKIVSTTVPGLSPGQEVWCGATTIDFPDLLTVGTTISGNLDHSHGWWIIKSADGR